MIGSEVFDMSDAFVLDINFFSSIIYILYEGGRLRPPVVRPRSRLVAEQLNFKEEEWRKRAERKRAARSGKQSSQPVPGGAQQ
jgi:hypothetical protein